MDTERWQRLRQFFLEALERDPSERTAFLDEACQGDHEIRSKVEEMLAADKGADEFLDQPPSFVRADTSRGDDLMDTRIGQYVLKRVISSGGMGTVYEAEQEHPRRIVAVKVMKTGIASKSALRRFEYESQILAKLSHPGIAQVFESGTHGEGKEKSGGVPYFVMEYIEGARPITDYAKEKALSLGERLNLFMQVCEAVHHGHQKGIIHRDLKPGNILVDTEGRVKIIDFGIARATDSDVALTTLHTDLGQLLGTVQYMSPEQCEADPHNLDIRSDVYALGVVLYELLCNQLPYDVGDKAIYEATYIIREQAPTRPSTTHRALRGDMETIVLKALEKDRERRFQSAEDLRRDIDRSLKGEPITARPPSAAYQLKIFVRRHKAFVIGTAAVFVVLVAGTITSTTLYFRATREAKTANAIYDFTNKMFLSLDTSSSFLVDFEEEEEEGMGLFHTGDYSREAALENMLQKSLPKIRETFAERPEVEAKIRETVGNALHGLGQYREAIRILKDTLEFRRKYLEENHPDTLLLQLRLAYQVSHTDLPEAETMLREILPGLRQVFGPEHRYTFYCETRLAHVMDRSKGHEESDRLFQNTLAAQQRVLGKNDRITLETGILWALKHTIPHRSHEGFPLAKEICEISRKAYGPDHPITIKSDGILAVFFIKRFEYSNAESLFRSVLERCRRVYGEEHPQTMLAIKCLAEALHGEDKLEEKEKLLLEALEVYRRKVGEGYINVTSLFDTYVKVLARQGRYDEVETNYRDRLSRCINEIGEVDVWTMDAHERLTNMLLSRGKIDEGTKELYQCIQRKINAYGEQDPETLIAMLSSAKTLWQLGKFDEARHMVEKATALGHEQVIKSEANAKDFDALARILLTCEPADLRNPPEGLVNAKNAVELSGGKDVDILETLALAHHLCGDHDQSFRIQHEAIECGQNRGWKKRWILENQLVDLQLRMGNAEAAKQFIKRIDDIALEDYGGIDNYLGIRLFPKVLLLVDAKQYAFAEPLARKCKETLKKGMVYPGTGVWEVMLCQCMVGRCLAGLGRFEEGEPPLLEGYEGLEGNPIVSIEYQNRALKWIVELYEGWGKPDQAAEWRAKLPAHLQKQTSATSDRKK